MSPGVLPVSVPYNPSNLNCQGTSGEGQSKDDGEEIRVEPYVDFSDFYRQVDELGENHVYGWDKSNNAAGETPA